MNNTSTFRLFDIDALIHATTKKIENFRELEKGWYFEEGVPFSETVLNNAIFLNEEAVRLGFLETDAFPGPNGEIMVTVYVDDNYLEFIVEVNSQVAFRYEQEGTEVDSQDTLSLQEAAGKIKEFYNQWNGYDSSTEITTTGVYGDSLLSPSDQPATTTVFPWLNLNASTIMDQVYGRILQSTTQKTQKTLPYSGFSTVPYYYLTAS